MPDLAAAYADTRRSMTDIVRNLSNDEATAPVPSCPGWSVRDLVAHVTSIAAALAAGTFPPDLSPLASLSDPAQAEKRERFVAEALAARRAQPLDAIVKEWEEAAPTLEAMIRGAQPWPDGAPPLIEWIVMTDLAVHHHDLRGAVGQPGERDSLATGLSLRSYVEAMRFRGTAMGLPAWLIRAGAREWLVGEGEPVATVTADPFELARAVSGRRSPEQVRAYEWQGDPEPFLPLFYPYGERADALVE